jgi:hypothetical protein
VVLLLELTHHADALMVPILLAVVEATVLARLLGAPSIYSARISAALEADGEPSAGIPVVSERDGATEPIGEPDIEAPSDLVPGSLAHNLKRR